MKKILTYYDIKASKTSKIFEAEEIKNLSNDQILEAEEMYNELLSKLKDGKDVEEGFFSSVAGGAVGALVGPALGKAICKVLGVDENGTLGKLLTSRLVSAAIGASLAK